MTKDLRVLDRPHIYPKLHYAASHRNELVYGLRRYQEGSFNGYLVSLFNERFGDFVKVDADED
jgi:hypothetical protein